MNFLPGLTRLSKKCRSRSHGTSRSLQAQGGPTPQNHHGTAKDPQISIGCRVQMEFWWSSRKIQIQTLKSHKNLKLIIPPESADQTNQICVFINDMQ